MNNTRLTVLEQASRLYAEKGYDGVSMRDVATCIGITPASLYHHFSDKEQLVRESLAHVFSQRAAPLETLLASSQTPREKLRAFVNWFVHLTCEDKVFTSLLARELLDADKGRLAYLAETVLNRPFSLITGIFARQANLNDPVMPAISVISLILGHVQMAAVVPYLPGTRAVHLAPEAIAQQVFSLLSLTLLDVEEEHCERNE